MYFLENDKIGLRALEEKDIEGNYGDWFNNSKVCQYNAHHKYPKTIEELTEYIRSLTNNNSTIVMAVIEKETKTHIGNVSLQKIDYISRQAEIAFLFGEISYWNKGYATMAAHLMIDHAFKELGMNRIYFGTAENNIGMQNVGRKLNFKQGGVRREATYNNGKFYDIYDYDLLRKEWKLE